MFRVVLVAALLAANTLNAQITTYITPPRAKAPDPQVVAVADSVRRDSVQRASITNMKAWVDSAAGVTVPSRVGEVDSTALANDPGRPVVTQPEVQRPVVTTFNEGSVAPDTASHLPLLTLLGVVLMLAGVFLATRPRS
jgi:hypothetical protein